MEYVLVVIGGLMVGGAAFSLWAEGYSGSKLAAACVGLVLATWGVFY